MGNESTEYRSQEDFAKLTISQQRDKFKQMIQSAENDIDKKLKAIDETDRRSGLKETAEQIFEYKSEEIAAIINKMKDDMLKKNMISIEQSDSMQYNKKAPSIKGAFFKTVSTLLHAIPATRNSDLSKSVYNKMEKAYAIAEAKAAVKAAVPKKRGLFKPPTRSQVIGR